jgi:hypothetical protein
MSQLALLPFNTAYAATAPSVADYKASNWGDQVATAEVTGTLTWSAGDTILVVGATENGTTLLETPTATGLTFSLIVAVNVNDNSDCATYAWAATAGSSGSSVITAGPGAGAGSNMRGIGAYAYTGSTGIGAWNIMDDSRQSLGGPSTIGLTRSYANSAIVNVMGDWNAINDTAVTPTPAGGILRQASWFTGAATFFLSDWGDQGAIGTSDYGLTDHSGSYDMSGIAIEIQGMAGELDQEGYRWRADNGSETSATWLAGQDVGILRAAETTTRLRALLNVASGDPEFSQYQLEYKKSSAGAYSKVATALPSAGGVSYGAIGAQAGSAVASRSVALPSGVTAQSELWATVGSKNNATHSSSTTGWTKVAQQNSGASWTVSLWRYTGSDATAAAQITVSWTGSVASFGQSWRIQGRTGSEAVGATTVNTGTAATHTTTSLTTTKPGSRVMYVDAAAANTTISAPSGWVENSDVGNTTSVTRLAVGGRDLGSAGSSSGAISITGAAAAWVQWQIELPPPQPAFILSPSSNILASGENTTAQLAAPSGKTTSNFIPGRMQDDENPADPIDAASNSYTELEWSIKASQYGVANGEVYGFRVTNNGGPLSTYSVIPGWTIGAGNVPPNVPTALTQTKTDNTSLATGAWTNETSIKLTANVTDADVGDTMRICAEVDPIGTAFSSPIDDADGCSVTGVSSGGTATVTISGLSSDTQYHWQIKAKNVDDVLYSTWVSYGGNVENPSTNPADRDFGVDTSAPTGGVVYDGSEAGVDKNFNDGSLSVLTANWAGFSFASSGIQKYEYSIGITPTGTTIKNWTDVGTTTSVSATGLVLQTSRTYYINIRATDSAGNTVIRSSDGQIIAPNLSFGVSPSSTTFNNINASNLYTSTGSTTLTTSTNAYGGYIVRAFATDFLRSVSNYTIGDFSGGTYAAPDAWLSGDTGFGYTSSDTSIQGVNKFQNSPCQGGSTLEAPGCYAPFTQTKPGDIVADHTTNVSGTPIVGEQFTVSMRATTASTQQAARYQTVIVYSITPLY